MYVCVLFVKICFCFQINDPDPYIWIPVYLTAAVLTLSIVIKPDVTDSVYWKYASVIHMSICISGSMLLVATVIQLLAGHVANPMQHEEGRELGGTVSIVVWLAICRFTSFGSSVPRKGSANALLIMTGMLGLLPLAVWTLCFIGGLHTKLGHCNGMFPGLLGSA
ncbi:hypothetical protein LSAT2_023824 [Lamellibrachia satsuma]|nr:hypothetical protein LSAT2_023824 [Lamellibrachia satsuma]